MKKLILVILFVSNVFANFKAIEILKVDGIIWGLDFISAHEIIFTVKSGKIGLYNLKTKKVQYLSNIPKNCDNGQGGLLDIKTHKGVIYFTMCETFKKGDTTSLYSFMLEKTKIKNLKRLFVADAHESSDGHFGSRVEIIDNAIYMSIGDRGRRDKVQSLSSHHGKILRFGLNGEVLKDNPFVDKGDSSRYIWTLGHRNPQGITLRVEDNSLWEDEFGPRGGDEINKIIKGENYGWPLVTHGKEYWGPSIGVKSKPGMRDPIKYYVPSISPSGSDFYTGQKLKGVKGDLFVAALGSKFLLRLKFDKDKIVKEYRYFEKLDERIRMVRESMDGHLYFSTDSGRIYRVDNK